MSEEKIKVYLGEVIRNLRKERGMTQEELAEKAGLTYKYLGLIEMGKANPSFSALFRISCALKIPLYKILKIAEERIYEEKKEEAPPRVAERREELIPKSAHKRQLLIKALDLLKEALSDD